MIRSTRRDVLLGSAAAVFGLASGIVPSSARAGQPTAAQLPRWRGFNLTSKFNPSQNEPFREDEFDIMREWGFDFARLPMSYWCWSKPTDWLRMDESVLKEVDQAVALGRKYKVHVNLNMHRIPGYCVNPPAEPKIIWDDEEALAAACTHWQMFARRYRGVPNTEVSFDLMNEPPDIPVEKYLKVHKRLIEAIREVDPQRLIVADGLRWGNTPVPELASMGVAQSTRGYAPMQISHYRANWVGGSDRYAMPTWPLKISEDDVWDEKRIAQHFKPWQDLAAQGVGVHVGEFGFYIHTPHEVGLAWMRTMLELWKKNGWGFALWNLRGGFGVLNTDRQDVEYVNFRGEKLDRKLLDLLRSH